MARRAELPNVIGVKDATNDLMRPTRTKRACGADFVQLSGEDGTALGYLAQGGVGCISVTANVAPKLCSMMQEAWMQNAIQTAQSINETLMPLHEAMFCEPSPAPAKFGASLLGKASPEVRLPLVPATSAARDRIRNAMAGAGLL